jgi:tetratricopeptide (TPR) repeat protein
MTTLDEHARAGILAINEQRIDDAIEHLGAALAMDGERPDLNNALGMAYLRRGEAVTAVPYLEKASRLAQPFDGPEHRDMRRHFESGLATAYMLLDRVADGRRVLEAAVARWPDDLDSRMQLGSLLVSSCLPEAGRDVYAAIADSPLFEEDVREAAEALAGAITVFLEDESLGGDVFLQAHAESYDAFFEQNAAQLETEGWFTEAARMVRGEDGNPKPIIAEGARPWAEERVDIVNPADGSVAKVGDEREPLIVAVNGLEPLAQVPVTLPWTGWPFEVWVCSRTPWHWVQLTIQFREARSEQAMLDAADGYIGNWYQAGYHGEFGERDKGRFHFATNPDYIGDRAITYTFDLGRASYDAVPDLLKRLSVLHDNHPLQRVVFGPGRLPD